MTPNAKIAAKESTVIARWNAATPRVPGNTIPGLSYLLTRAPDSVLRSSYTEAFHFESPASYTRVDLVGALTAWNAAVEGADARCMAALVVA